MDVGVSVDEAKRKKTKTERQRQYSSWCNLPDDIIYSIMNRLYYVDQIRFRAVCKSWREVEIQGLVKPADKLPWNMAIDSHSIYLYDPSHKQKYTVENSITNSGIFIHAEVHASKGGWILFAKSKTKLFLVEELALFFYSPFTNNIIQLPNLIMRSDSKATFTTSPLSPDCETFVVTAYYDTFCIHMCKPGDTRWTKMSEFYLDEIYYDLDEIRPDPHIEYVDGILYITFEQTVVVAFNVALKEWKIFPYPLDAGCKSVYDYLIESDGNLLLTYGGDFRLPYHGLDRYPVFRLDPSQMNWIRVQNLDDTSLFLDTYTSFSIPAGDHETSELAGTVHSELCHHGCPCPKISKIYDLDRRYLTNVWIQPPPWR